MDLLGALSDYLLRSGFQENMWYELPEGEQTMDALRRASRSAPQRELCRPGNARPARPNADGR